jgi:hypothetical protein
MEESMLEQAVNHSDVRFRVATPRDGLAMWRLARHRYSGMSPFALVSLLRHVATTSVVAEQDGELVGFVIARPRPEERALKLLDGALASDQPAGVLHEMVTTLLALPDCRGVEYLDAAPSCQGPMWQTLFDCWAPISRERPRAKALTAS